MDTSPHDLHALFRQLGLSDTPAAIDDFVASHRLEPRLRLGEAPFWKPAQAAFLREALANDSDWAEAADELAALLSRPR